MHRLHENPKNIAVIAGPCSVSGPHNLEIYEAQLNFFQQFAGQLTGIRVVGYKSRTSPDTDHILNTLQQLDNHTLLHLAEIDPELNATAKNYYGLDVCEILVTQRLFLEGVGMGSDQLPDLPSVLLAKSLQDQYAQLLIATEVIEPMIQMPQLKKHLKPGSVLVWTPSSDALGASKSMYRQLPLAHNVLAIKNPKWLGIHPDNVTEENVMALPGVKAMIGCMQWANSKTLIHRGFELEEKDGHRAKPVHSVFSKLKRLNPDLNLIFDPSHSLGPSRRDQIVDESIRAIVDHGYHGLLIEASTATTDINQHISTDEMLVIMNRLKAQGYGIKQIH